MCVCPQVFFFPIILKSKECIDLWPSSGSSPRALSPGTCTWFWCCVPQRSSSGLCRTSCSSSTRMSSKWRWWCWVRWRSSTPTSTRGSWPRSWAARKTTATTAGSHTALSVPEWSRLGPVSWLLFWLLLSSSLFSPSSSTSSLRRLRPLLWWWRPRPRPCRRSAQS